MAENNNSKNIIGYISLALTEDGEILIDHESILDVGIRIRMLEVALDIEDQIAENMFKRDSNGNFCS